MAHEMDATIKTRRIKRLQKLAWWLDSGIPVPGTKWRIGFDGIIGLIPHVGDAIGALFSLYIVFEAWRLHVSRWILFKMLLNIGIELIIGIIPVMGDFFDFVWKANLRNLSLLEKDLQSNFRADLGA